MISEVVMPQMGADMTEGTVLRWLKHEGDNVERGEIIAEIETDKANVEIEAFEGGTFRKALAGEGDTVHVGEVIAVIGDPSDDISAYATGAGAPAAARTAGATSGATAAAATPPSTVATAPQEGSPTIGAQPSSEQPPTPAPPPGVHHAQPTTEEVQAGASTNGRLRASPVARRIARERGVDLHQVRGSGPDGRILRSDVEQFSSPAAAAPAHAAAPSRPPAAPAAAAPAPTSEVVRMSRMRQAIARRMAQSKREAPHYYLLVDIDMTGAIDLRRQINDALDGDDDAARVSINDLIVRACALALQRHPAFNATMEGDQVTRHGAQNACIAIAMDDGLVAPAVLDAGRKSLTEIARETKDLVARTKGGALRPEEMSDGTFTITNLGAYGIETLIGIIQPPQTAILGVGSVMEQPVAVDGVIGTKQVMKVALSADHRVTDGAQGAQFLGEIKRLLERPVLLLI